MQAFLNKLTSSQFQKKKILNNERSLKIGKLLDYVIAKTYSEETPKLNLEGSQEFCKQIMV